MDERPKRPFVERRAKRRADPTEMNDAVRAVLDSKREEAAERKQARVDAQRREQRQTPMVVTLLVTTSLLAWMWIARPVSIFGGSAPVELPAAKAEAKARYALYLERARVDEYRRTYGRLPERLEDAGPVEEGVTYSVVGSGFVLESTVNGQSLRLTNAMHADTFLGESIDVLRGTR